MEIQFPEVFPGAHPGQRSGQFFTSHPGKPVVIGGMKGNRDRTAPSLQHRGSNYGVETSICGGRVRLGVYCGSVWLFHVFMERI